MPAAKQDMVESRGLLRRIVQMQRLFVLSVLLFLFAYPAMAQDAPATTQPADATKAPVASTAQDTAAPPTPRIVSKTEVSGGFAVDRYYEPGNGGNLNLIGGYGDVEHNIIQRWLGAEIEAAGGYKNQGVPGALGIYTIMAGPVFYPLGHRKITAFGHILAGEGYYRDSISPSAGFPAQVITHTSLAWTIGGGLDMKVSRHLGVRVAQFDYEQTKFFGGTVHESNTRISVGFVYHFGAE
jgi:opacity protein-like surface antigen